MAESVRILSYRIKGRNLNKKALQKIAVTVAKHLGSGWQENILSGSIRSRIEKSHFLDFYGHNCKSRSNSGGSLSLLEYRSSQHVSGYMSAIKDHFGNMDNNLQILNEK